MLEVGLHASKMVRELFRARSGKKKMFDIHSFSKQTELEPGTELEKYFEPS